MGEALTLFEKIWRSHIVLEEQGEALVRVDLALIHEGSAHAFRVLDAAGRGVARPRQVYAFADHYVPSSGRARGVAGIPDAGFREMVLGLERNSARFGIQLFGYEDERQGILHVVPPELGMTQPGLIIVGQDSHSCTHGALGAWALGAGASEMTHVLATQTAWLRKPKTMRVTVEGGLPPGVTAKDLILALIAKIGAGGADGYVVEYAGPAIAAMTVEARMTVCNMSVEAGARSGLIAPDEKTFAYLEGKPYAPRGAAWREALAHWRTLRSDGAARFDREERIEAGELAPMVTWGTSPEHAAPICGVVPDPGSAPDPVKREEMAAALDYMGLAPGTPLAGIRVDRVFIGSCTNGRIEDLRAAAEVARRGRAVVPSWVVPGSMSVKRQAEREGLAEVFLKAGFEWRDPGCSMCSSYNGDEMRPGERSASTTNRNFRGRQGPGARTHLVSPAMAAAAALTGRLTDVREFMR
ncbi:MAG TPA: 3-isopropylmalate dehydratase large subunit [Burkholderiales bacterium]|nr:3-isopropylmalate dehydratase large subunit [Burkholderiales bacterium]